MTDHELSIFMLIFTAVIALSAWLFDYYVTHYYNKRKKEDPK